jgi:hypothetical protein
MTVATDKLYGFAETDDLFKFVESWFYDKFCKAADCKSQEEFIDRTWNLCYLKNDDDVKACSRAAIEAGFSDKYDFYRIKNWLSDYANDVIFSMWEDGDLPDHYAKMYEEDGDIC